jgi:plastocyanin
MLFWNSLQVRSLRAAAPRPRWPGLFSQRRPRIKAGLSRASLFVFLAALIGVVVVRIGLSTPALGQAADTRNQNPNTYTVLVGAEHVAQGASVVGYFPTTLSIHVGDTVHWQRNANEIHTVTILAGTPLPPLNVPAPPGQPSPLMRNPLLAFPAAPANGRYDGTTYATSGIFGPDPNIYQGVKAFDLTFTKPGTYNYVCGVHGVRMSGQIIVVDRGQHIPSPHHVHAHARRLIAQALAGVPAALAKAKAEVPPPTANPDGTTTFHVLVGFSVGQLDLLHFFPRHLTVHPGDTVDWKFTMEDVPRHTVTFLNGNPDPDDLLVVPQPKGPPLLLVNPEVLFPQNVGKPLTRQGIYSSGIVLPRPAPILSLKIGDIRGHEPYKCLLHDTSGMTARLHIVPN